MKVLVVTYSFTGTGDRLARLLCSSRGWTSAQVVERRPRRRLATLHCALDSWLRREPRIRYQGPEPEDFDLVVLVAPIWLYRLASPMRSFVALFRGQLRRVAVITLMGGKGGQNAAAEVGRLLGHAPLMTATFTAREIEDGSFAPRLMAFGDALAASAPSPDPLRPSELSPVSAS